MEPTVHHADVTFQTGHRASFVTVTVPLPVDLKAESRRHLGPLGLMEYTEHLGEAVRHPDDTDDPQVAYLLALSRALQSAANAAGRRAEGRIRMNDHNRRHSKRAKQLAQRAKERAEAKAAREAEEAKKPKKRKPAPSAKRCRGTLAEGGRCTRTGSLEYEGKRYCKTHVPSDAFVHPAIEVEFDVPPENVSPELADALTGEPNEPTEGET